MVFVPTARHLPRAKDLADARYFEPLSVDDLAPVAGLSRAHFSHELSCARRGPGRPGARRPVGAAELLSLGSIRRG